MDSVFKVENGKHVSFELKEYQNGKFSTTLYSDTLGYAGRVTGTTIVEVLANEIKKIQAKIKSHPKEKSLRCILLEVKKKRIEHSQLTLF